VEPDGQALIDQYRVLHASRLYGHTSVKNLRFIRPHIRLLGPSSILDYGCGRSALLEALGLGAGVRTLRYDPAIPEYSTPPTETVDLVINIDVLEHIPESDLPATLEQMRALGRQALIVIDTRPASTILPNGENAHCTLHPHEWWRDYLLRFYPHVVPVRAARRSRAAFRTWELTTMQSAALRAMRLKESAAYWLQRAVNKAVAPRRRRGR
jgi:hypothetical protein